MKKLLESGIALLLVFLASCEVAPISYSLTINVFGEGTVTDEKGLVSCTGVCNHEMPAGQVVLSATPVSGYTFEKWSGGGCVGSSACIVELNGTTNVIATFKLEGSEPSPNPNPEPNPTPNPNPSPTPTPDPTPTPNPDPTPQPEPGPQNYQGEWYWVIEFSSGNTFDGYASVSVDFEEIEASRNVDAGVWRWCVINLTNCDSLDGTMIIGNFDLDGEWILATTFFDRNTEIKLVAIDSNNALGFEIDNKPTFAGAGQWTTGSGVDIPGRFVMVKVGDQPIYKRENLKNEIQQFLN